MRAARAVRRAVGDNLGSVHRLAAMPPATRRLLTSLIGLALLASACSRTSVDFSNVPELPAVTLADVAAALTTSERPVVLNVWASWCIPCRSEAPLLDAASNAFGAEVRFIGLNVRDSQNGARGFIAEFLADAPIEHLYDRPGTISTRAAPARCSRSGSQTARRSGSPAAAQSSERPRCAA